MAQILSIHSEVASTGGTLLLEVAIALREHRLRPDRMDWSLTAPDTVVWRIAAPVGREFHLPKLVERVQQVPGVIRVEINDAFPPACSQSGS